MKSIHSTTDGFPLHKLANWKIWLSTAHFMAMQM